MASSDGLLPGLSIHHSVNIGGALALFAPYALVSDAGVAVISLTEGQRAPSWQVMGGYFNRNAQGEDMGLSEKLSQFPKVPAP